MMWRWWLGILLVSASIGCMVDPVERNNTGNALSRDGDYEDALRAYEVALVHDPQNALYYFNVAQAFEGMGDIEGAIETLEQAIERGDLSLQVAAYHNLGNVYFRQGRYEEAIEAYRNALRLDDESADTRFNLELALGTRTLPTPTPQEMQTNPEDQQADDEQEPTPNPMNLNEPTPTPSPVPPPPNLPTPDGPGEEGVPVEEADLPTSPQEGGDFSVEDVERILNIVEAENETAGGIPDMPSLGATPGAKDW